MLSLRCIRSIASALLPVLLTWLVATPPALAYTYAGNYTFTARWNEWGRYQQGGYTVYPAEHLGGLEYDVCPSLQTRALFPAAVVSNVKQTCDNLWKALLNSPYLLGSAASGVRARDVSEDWDLNIIDPSDNVRNHYFDWYANSLVANPYVLRSGYPLYLDPVGPQAGAYVVGNPNVLAMGDDVYVMLDPDGSLSYYVYAGGWMLKDSAAKTFTNGPWSGQKLTSKLQHMIGYEELQLYFLEGSSTLHVFDRDLKWVRTDNVKLGHELSAYTLGDLVDNKIPGYTYIGWDAGPIVIGVGALRPLDHFLVSSTVSQVEVGQSLTLTIQACESTDGCGTPYTRGATGTLLLSNGTLQAFTIPVNASSTQITLPITSRPSDGMLAVSLPIAAPVAVASSGTLCQFGSTATPSSDCRIPVVPPLKHIELSGPASGITCASSTFTVKACGSTDCQTPFTQGLSGTLMVGGSGTQASPGTAIAFTIPAGQSSVNVSVQVTRPPAGGIVPLSISGLSVIAGDTSALYCALGTSASPATSCPHQVSRSGFALQVPHHLSEASGVTARITAIRSNADQSACVPAFTGDQSVTMSCAHLNPGTAAVPVRLGSQSLNASGSSTQACDASGRTMTLNFRSDGSTEIALAYADVGQLQLKATVHGAANDPDAGMSGSTTFVVAPAGFAVERVGGGTGPILAGQAFALRLTAINSLNTATPGFGRIDSAGAHPIEIGWSLSEPTGTGARAGTLGGTGTATGAALTAAAFGTSGELTLNDIQWSEVGKGRVSATLNRAGGFLDSGLQPSGQSTALGPFVPAYFETALTAGCGSFSYSGQPLQGLTVTARNAQGDVTRNFDGTGSLAPVQATGVSWQLDAVAGSSGTLSASGLSASQFTAGVGQPSPAPSYTFNQKLSAPIVAQLGILRSDGASSTQNLTANWAVRSGRLVLSDAYGSERTPLDMSVQAQHWSGKSWVQNSGDSCTRIPNASVGLSNHRNQAGLAMAPFSTPPTTQLTLMGQPQAIVIQSGRGTLRLGSPPAGITGTLDVSLNLGNTATDRACVGTHPATSGAMAAWLRFPLGSGVACPSTDDRDPGAKATFGIFSPESRRVIHTQDLF